MLSAPLVDGHPDDTRVCNFEDPTFVLQNFPIALKVVYASRTECYSTPPGQRARSQSWIRASLRNACLPGCVSELGSTRPTAVDGNSSSNRFMFVKYTCCSVTDY